MDEAGAPVVRWDSGIGSRLVESRDEWVSRWAPAAALDGFAALTVLELMEDISEEGYRSSRRAARRYAIVGVLDSSGSGPALGDGPFGLAALLRSRVGDVRLRHV